MEKFLIKGKCRLQGEVTIGGAKNAAVAIIPATVLAEGPCILENIPDISDVHVLFDALEEMGAKVEYLGGSRVAIDTSGPISTEVPYELSRQMRGSYYFLGALLGRYDKASVSMPGGCRLGVRPIDQHIKGFEHLGSTIEIEETINATAENGLIGAPIAFDIVSVGATINVMLAAVKAKGITVLENAAKEPHIVDLANFLNSMGADVRGAGTDTIKIHGVSEMHGSEYAIIPDQIEAGTFMVAAAATGGDVLVKNVIPKHMESVSRKLIKAGATVVEKDDSIRVSSDGNLKAITIKTTPHPGFPTDMQPQITTLLTQAKGTSVVTEGIFDSRFRYVDELLRMGANIEVDGKVAVVKGPTPLTSAPVKASDLRAGAALMIAAFMAEGVTEIEDIHHIERGYENVLDKFNALGANIKHIDIPNNISAT